MYIIIGLLLGVIEDTYNQEIQDMCREQLHHYTGGGKAEAQVTLLLTNHDCIIMTDHCCTRYIEMICCILA